MANPDNLVMEEYLRENSQEYDLVAVFGSYARLEAYSASDYDVLIIDDRFDGWNVYETAEPVSFEWPDDFQPLHLVCCSHDEFTERYHNGDEMVEAICEEGVAIHPQFGLSDYF